jgi:hypothetical protein
MADEESFQPKANSVIVAIIDALQPICASYMRSGEDWDSENFAKAQLACLSRTRKIFADYTIADAVIAHATTSKALDIRGEDGSAQWLALMSVTEILADFISGAAPESVIDVAARVQFFKERHEKCDLSQDHLDSIIDRLPYDLSCIRRADFPVLQSFDQALSYRATRFGRWCSRADYEEALQSRMDERYARPGEAPATAVG